MNVTLSEEESLFFIKLSFYSSILLTMVSIVALAVNLYLLNVSLPVTSSWGVKGRSVQNIPQFIGCLKSATVIYICLPISRKKFPRVNEFLLLLFATCSPYQFSRQFKVHSSQNFSNTAFLFILSALDPCSFNLWVVLNTNDVTNVLDLFDWILQALFLLISISKRKKFLVIQSIDTSICGTGICWLWFFWMHS